MYWRPLDQQYNATSVLVVRTPAGEEALPMLRKVVADLDADVVVYDTKSLRGFIDVATGPYFFISSSLDAMGFLAAFLVAIGISGLMAYSVARRTREIAIRKALGAATADVLRSLLTRLLILVTLSCGVGLALSVALTRLLSPFLLHAPGASTYVAGLMLVWLISAAACVLPLRRALRVEPFLALRHE